MSGADLVFSLGPILLALVGNLALATLLVYHRRQLDHAAATQERMHQEWLRLSRARLGIFDRTALNLPSTLDSVLPGLAHQRHGATWICDRCGATGTGDSWSGFAGEEVEHLLDTGCPGTLRAA